MGEFLSATRPVWRRSSITALGLVLGFLASAEPALARHHHYAPHRSRVSMSFRVYGHLRPHHVYPAFYRPAHVRPGSYTPPFSAYAVDGNSGRVLYGQDENAPRHPASITKVMTLYLLFEQMEKGRISLDSRIEVSPHAAAQAPTKLGLRPGSTIRVEDAIKSIVTKSANDMAVAVAERLGGDEDNFARMMTRKAHALGMSRSNFVNASGLPDDRQITTARDLAVLGRAIHDHYPRYFRFFSTPSFRYAGQYMANHNHLMEHVEGMDGIKTGYTRSSGFNLLSSVNRNGHWLVAVVLGGKSRLGRDRIMEDMIETQIAHCATTRTAPMVAENPALEHVAEAIPVIAHESDPAPPVEGVDDESAVERPVERPIERPLALHRAPAVDEDAPAPQVEPVEAEPQAAPKVRVPVKLASLTSDAPTPRPRPAFVSGLPRAQDHDMTTTGSISRRAAALRLDGSTARYIGAATATPSTLRHRPQRERVDNAREAAKPIKLASLDRSSPIPAERPVTHGGILIQIGAPPSIEQANALLEHAKGEAHGLLARARPFTEKVRKGDSTLYRARFAGLDADAAEAACRGLKRAGIACFTTRN